MKRNSSLLALGLALAGCSLDLGDDNASPAWQSPDGPVATNAAEAWPTPPAGVPGLTPQQILSACGRAGECSPQVMAEDVPTRAGLVDLCVHDIVFSAERAIPMSGFNLADERAEFWVGCVLDAGADCTAVEKCRTKRDPRIQCQEDGCYATEKLSVSCQGSVATLQGKSGTSTRDCSRAFADCDPASITGCTDRHYTRCAKDDAPGDRCDGAIRLGCDGADQVSYHDCSRMGGTCGTEPDGSQGCVYPTTNPCPLGNFIKSSCAGGVLTGCLLGEQQSLPSALCADG